MGRFVIKTPVPAVNGRHWELEFTNGVAETEDEGIAARYEARGYMVERPQPPKRKAAKKE